MADTSTSLPELDLAPTATITVDTGDPAAIVTQLVIYGTYYPPAAIDQGGTGATPLWLPLPDESPLVVKA